MKRTLSRYLARLLLLIPLAATAEPTLNVAIREEGGDKLYQLTKENVVKQQSLPTALSTPLGSLWKLYVYAWLTDRQITEAPYTCHGADKEEVYCCSPGEQITRDQALVRSCGLYFSPTRLNINPGEWQQYWQKQRSPGWLQQLSRLQPETRVPVSELLETLSTLPGREIA
ncbi:MAG: hypothetical protein XXXJIFNMEKO3_03206 [Candidatus Erwinia impunctatus]|nr:hypothetical protein XXXJIFNMEKO_03206 [Culicoides impunctatus]